MKFKGKKAVITGGTRGIGRAVAKRFAAQGCELVLNYLDKKDAAEETAEIVKQAGSIAHLLQGNLMDPMDAKRLAKQAVEQLGQVDYFIHCAALGSFKRTAAIKSNQWDLSMNINAKAFLMMCQQIKPVMPAGSSIVALSSSGSNKVVPNYGAIGISKAALESLVRYLAVDYIPDGVRVNTVSGGFIDTQSLSAFPEYERLRDEAAKRTPAGRIGNPDDLASVVEFLCSDESRWIVGQVLLADGGMSLV